MEFDLRLLASLWLFVGGAITLFGAVAVYSYQSVKIKEKDQP